MKYIWSIILSVVFLVFLSWFTTSRCIIYSIPKGVWELKILNTKGQPISNVEITETGFSGVNPKQFDNFINNTKITSRNGIVKLSNTRSLHGGANAFDLFWIFPIKKGGPPYFKLKIQSPGYKDKIINSKDIFSSKNTLIVELEKRNK